MRDDTGRAGRGLRRVRPVARRALERAAVGTVGPEQYAARGLLAEAVPESCGGLLEVARLGADHAPVFPGRVLQGQFRELGGGPGVDGGAAGHQGADHQASSSPSAAAARQ
jgi:hypothetical protein